MPFKSMKTHIIFFVALFPFFACENENICEINGEEANVNDRTNIVEHNKGIDTVQNLSTEKIKGISVQKKKASDSTSTKSVKELIDIDYFLDPFEDPDYIGTPCDDWNGKCTRHNHKDEHLMDRNHIKLDSSGNN